MHCVEIQLKIKHSKEVGVILKRKYKDSFVSLGISELFQVFHWSLIGFSNSHFSECRLYCKVWSIVVR